MVKTIAVIGAGLAGTTIASRLNEKFDVKVFEKSRGVGGRMSTRQEATFIFDHGAQFFKIKTKIFRKNSRKSIQLKLVAVIQFTQKFRPSQLL